MSIKYSIFDPTGNITALVETPVDSKDQADVAAGIMEACPEAEQVGFVRFEAGRPVPVMLRMAGGEFCGNAAMSAAALYILRSGEETDRVRVNVSGASMSIEVKLLGKDDGSFDAGVSMLPPLEIGEKNLKSEASKAAVMTVVRMEGISHIVIEDPSELYAIKDDRDSAERLVKGWCRDLDADCLGLMFLKREKDAEADYMLTPLVYVPGADTIFWENSCASGTAACGMYLAHKTGKKIDIKLKEPAGYMRVTSDIGKEETVLYGNTKMMYNGTI